MKKILLLCLSLFLTQSLWAGSSILMTHDKFALLDDKEKERVVIQTMELIVELEARYQHEVTTQVNASPTKEKIQKLVRLLSSYVMNSAYAQDENSKKSWVQRGEDFVALMDKGANRCIYAGWVSTVVNNVCVHPSKALKKVKGKWVADQKVRNAYKNSASPSCERQGVNKIACNPVVFGFSKINGKSEGSSSLFCVDAGKGPAHNSSLECMEEATKSKDNIDFLKAKLSEGANERITNGVHKYITEACICTEQPKNFNKKYHEYMKPHRTCYGLMSMITNTYGQCTQDPSPIFKQFEQIQSSLVSDIVKSTDKTNSTDEAYAELLKKYIKKEEVAALCGGAPEEDDDSDDAPGPQGPNCEVVSCLPTAEGSNKLKCDVKLHTGQKDSQPIDYSFEISKDLPPSHEINLADIDKNLTGKLVCDAKETQKEDNAIQCTKMSFSVADGKITATAEYDLKDLKIKEPQTPTWTPASTTGDAKTATFDLPKDAKSFEASLSLPLDGGKVLSCSGKWPDGDPDAGKKPSIKAKKEAESPATVKAVGVITIQDKDAPKEVKKADGYITVWYRKGHANLGLPEVKLDEKKEEPKKDAKPPVVAGDGDGEKKPEDVKPEEPKKPELPKPKVGEGKEIIATGKLDVEVPRSPKGDYQVCVELQGKDVIEGGCVTVPKIAAPMNGQQGGPGRPQHATNTGPVR